MSDFDHKTREGRPLKIGSFDCETTDLKANDGYMLCACIKDVNKDNLRGAVHSVYITPKESLKSDDSRILKELVTLMDSYDVLVTWYGSMFDHKFVNTRCLKHGITPPVRKYRRDLCFVARGIGALKNNRLASWGNYLFGASGKTFLPWKTWIQAIRGDSKALNDILFHCEKDVLETEKIYKRFGPLLGKLRK